MFEKWCSAGLRMVREMEMEDVAAFKVCLLATGVLMGASLSPRGKKPATLLAGLLAAGLGVPLISKVTQLAAQEDAPPEE